MRLTDAIALIEAGKPKIFELLAAYTARSEVEDIMQTAYARLIHSQPDMDNPTGYFYTVCRRIILEERCKPTRIVPMTADLEIYDRPDPHMNPEELLSFEQELEAIERKFGSLRPRAKRIYEMWSFEGYLYSEIAKQFLISESMVKKYLAQARTQLGQYENGLRACDVFARQKRSKRFRAAARESQSSGTRVGEKA